jgi:membrane protein
VKPRHDLRHRQKGHSCGFERSRRDDEHAFDREVLGTPQRHRTSCRDDDTVVGSGAGASAVSSSWKPGWKVASTWELAPESDESASDVAGHHDEKLDSHGRTAASPEEIPEKGWRDILSRVRQNLGRDHTSVVAAGIGLHGLLAVFPALAVIVSVYGMFASPQDVANDLQFFLGVLPADAAKLLTAQLQSLAATRNHTLGFGAVAATLLALWNSRKGVGAVMTATNIAYKEQDQRSFLYKLLLSVAFSLAAMLIFAVMLLVGVAVPALLQAAHLGRGASTAVLVLRWVLLWSFAVLGFSFAYRYAPDRQRPKWRWVTLGSVVAASVWILGSLAFSEYVRSFGSYGKTYGALGGVIVLIMWFYLMGFTIVLGAEINAEMEHQTAVDTTEGPPAPMGERGAYVADTLGRAAK